MRRSQAVGSSSTGDSKDVGEEFSLLAELRKWDNLEIDIAAAVFEGGDAFGTRSGERAKSLFVKLAYEF